MLSQGAPDRLHGPESSLGADKGQAATHRRHLNRFSCSQAEPKAYLCPESKIPAQTLPPMTSSPTAHSFCQEKPISC